MTTRFSVGDIVSYSNKEKRLNDVSGIIIGIYDGYQYQIVPITPLNKDVYWYAHHQIHQDHQFDKNQYEKYSGRWWKAREKCICVPLNSRTLKHGLKTYDPSQNGDTEDDI